LLFFTASLSSPSSHLPGLCLSHTIHGRRAQNSTLSLQLDKVWRSRLVRIHPLSHPPFFLSNSKSHTLLTEHPSILLSRKYLIQLHTTPADSNAADALVTAYHTLLSATLSHWTPKHLLTPSEFTAFVKSLLLSLPSSSQDAPSPAASAVGELLIDTLWSIDSQLDEIIADSKAAIVAQPEKQKEKGKGKEQVNGRPEELGTGLSRDTATKDKGSLVEIVKLLLVCPSFRLGSRGVEQYFFLIFSDRDVFSLACVDRWRRKSRSLQRAVRHVARGKLGSHLGQAFFRQKGGASAYGPVVRISSFVSSHIYSSCVAAINRTSSISYVSNPRVSPSSLPR
jgi:hypothetical protein